MADWNFGFTALRIAKLFAESTSEKHCCADITRNLDVPNQTVWNALQSLRSARILCAEKEWVSPTVEKREPRIFYRFTPEGHTIACEALAAVKFKGTILS